MKTIKFTRKGHVIRSAEGEVIFTGLDNKKNPSVNAAKRESRKLQMEADGGLGRGTLRTL